MSRRDTSHETVRRSLERDGWTITHDPYLIRLGDLPMGIDLGAEKLIAADRDNRRIAVEVKSFVGTSDLSTFHTALGQYLNYQFALDEEEPERSLYRAVPTETWESFFARPAIRQVCARFGIKILVFSVDAEIVSWIE